MLIALGFWAVRWNVPPCLEAMIYGASFSRVKALAAVQKLGHRTAFATIWWTGDPYILDCAAGPYVCAPVTVGWDIRHEP